MQAPNLLIKPCLDKRGYRLKCRFKIEPLPEVGRLAREKVRVAEMFVRDMAAQGWTYDNRSGFRMTGPYPPIEPVTIHQVRLPSAKEMLPQVIQGCQFLNNDGGTQAGLMPLLAKSEYWEFEIAGVFIRDALMVEQPDLHEEDR